jgi:hypothetical protein
MRTIFSAIAGLALLGSAFAGDTLQVQFTPTAPQPNTQPLQFTCTNGAWTINNLVMQVQTNFNNEGFMTPSTTTGLPTINMNWYVNAAAATTLTVTGAQGVNNAKTVQPNTFQFQLMDDVMQITATFAVGTCTTGQTAPPIQVAFVPVNAVINTDTQVTTINNFNAANQFIQGVTTPQPTQPVTVAPTTTTTTVAPTVVPTTAATQVNPTTAAVVNNQVQAAATTQNNMMMPALIGVGSVVGVGAAVGTAFAYRAYSRRKLMAGTAHVPLADAI